MSRFLHKVDCICKIYCTDHKIFNVPSRAGVIAAPWGQAAQALRNIKVV